MKRFRYPSVFLFFIWRKSFFSYLIFRVGCVCGGYGAVERTILRIRIENMESSGEGLYVLNVHYSHRFHSRSKFWTSEKCSEKEQLEGKKVFIREKCFVDLIKGYLNAEFVRIFRMYQFFLSKMRFKILPFQFFLSLWLLGTSLRYVHTRIIRIKFASYFEHQPTASASLSWSDCHSRNIRMDRKSKILEFQNAW